MNNSNKIMLLVVIMLLINISFAQKNTWTLGFRTGYKIETLEKTNPSEIIKIANEFSSRIHYPNGNLLHANDLNAGLYLTYNITDRISITSGIVHQSFYTPTWKVYLENDKKKRIILKDGHLIYRHVQIPLYMKYAFPLGKSNFNMYGKLGFQLDIFANTRKNQTGSTGNYLPDNKDTIFMLYYESTTTLYDRKVNVLLNAGIGFEYRFKKGIGLSIEGEYYAGMRTIGQILLSRIGIADATGGGFSPGHYVVDIPDILLLIKGSYWNVNLGISYTFKNKKAQNKNSEILPEHREISM